MRHSLRISAFPPSWGCFLIIAGPIFLSESAAGSGSYPLSDAAAAGMVQRSPEVRPDNSVFNNTKPTSSQLQNVQSLSYMNSNGNYLLHRADGQYTGTTDEILQWGAYKWGFDPNLIRAEAVDESSWYQNEIGDIGNGVSLGILQIKSKYYLGTCPESPNFGSFVNARSATSIQRYLASQPNCLTYNSTAFAVDYRLAHYRACMNKDISYLNNYPPTPGYPTYAAATGDNLLWGCMGVWYSGYWWDSDAILYIQRVKSALESMPWLSY